MAVLIQHLWASDGSPENTQEVAIIPSIHQFNLALLNQTLYFITENMSNRQLWKSDGMWHGCCQRLELYSSYENLTTFGNLVYFVGSDGLWRSDGTAAGTIKLNDPATFGDIRTLTVWNGMLYFHADSLQYGVELWKSDGSATGTSLVKDINTITNPSYPSGAIPFKGALYFSADNNHRTRTVEKQRHSSRHGHGQRDQPAWQQ